MWNCEGDRRYVGRGGGSEREGMEDYTTKIYCTRTWNFQNKTFRNLQTGVVSKHSCLFYLSFPGQSRICCFPASARVVFLPAVWSLSLPWEVLWSLLLWTWSYQLCQIEHPLPTPPESTTDVYLSLDGARMPAANDGTILCPRPALEEVNCFCSRICQTV